MKYMRIVARSDFFVHVQTSDHRNRDYKQTVMKHPEFIEFMAENFPQYWKEYTETPGGELDPVKFFYHYGETREMRIKGESYIFEK